ncbi:hypothetical protein [Sutcliffiella horikoshii]|uniref:hypothetical protein n=1 Tax=Sutcliffiella horikoshii TaxID=79883 RepID=UPI0038510CB7
MLAQLAMTLPSDIDADSKNVDVEVVLTSFAVMLIFAFGFAMGLVFIFGAKVVVAFHMFCTSFKRKGAGCQVVSGTRPSTFSIILCMFDEDAWAHVLQGEWNLIEASRFNGKGREDSSLPFKVIT